jgi:hypothetical protein
MKATTVPDSRASMLAIRTDQMQALDEQMERQFVRRLAGSLRCFFPFRFTRG